MYGGTQAISIHVPREGHDNAPFCLSAKAYDFNPRAPRGARLIFADIDFIKPVFQSTCPARGTTAARSSHNRHYAFQSTCPARGTTDRPFMYDMLERPFQSTCPARGTTYPVAANINPDTDFNPRAPRGARQAATGRTMTAGVFQSTCPARGTTVSLHGLGAYAVISIHVPREGHDHRHLAVTPSAIEFQSTCPARGTTPPRRRGYRG